MKYIFIPLILLLMSGCAYTSENYMDVTADKFKRTLLSTSCEGCSFTVRREMDTKKAEDDNIYYNSVIQYDSKKK